MSVEPKNPLGMVPDPYAGDTFTFPDTLCTEQRRLWFRRANEIFAFLMMTEFAIKECRTRYEQIVSQKKLNANTPFKLESSDGKSVVTPLKTFLEKLGSNVDILCRQVFLMFYGSLETYLFELLELSFPKNWQNRKYFRLFIRNYDGIKLGRQVLQNERYFRIKL